MSLADLCSWCRVKTSKWTEIELKFFSKCAKNNNVLCCAYQKLVLSRFVGKSRPELIFRCNCGIGFLFRNIIIIFSLFSRAVPRYLLFFTLKSVLGLKLTVAVLSIKENTSKTCNPNGYWRTYSKRQVWNLVKHPLDDTELIYSQFLLSWFNTKPSKQLLHPISPFSGHLQPKVGSPFSQTHNFLSQVKLSKLK